ncbi:MAG TPA: hypothetical protein EYG91_03400 [Aquifex aeolicus]|nr:hypothetical protein [Aquifex aeolicus]
MREILRDTLIFLLRNWEFLLAWIFFLTLLFILTPLPYIGVIAFFLILLLFNSATMYFIKVHKEGIEEANFIEILKPKKAVFSYTVAETTYIYFVALLSYLFTKLYITLVIWWLFYKPYLSKELYIAQSFKEGFQAMLVLLLKPNCRYAKVGVKWLIVSSILIILSVFLIFSIAGVLFAPLLLLWLDFILGHFAYYVIKYVRSLD